MLRRLLALATLALVAVLGVAAPAWAHVEIDPAEAVAGTTATITLTAGHGPEDGPTTEMVVRLPEGASVSGTPSLDGWTVTVDEEAGTVTWSGGSAPGHDPFAVTLDVVLPTTAGEVLFPVIQTGPDGEAEWIGEDPDGDNPAPRLTVTPGSGGTTSTTEDGSATSTTEDDLPDTTVEASEVDDGDTSLAPWLIGAGIAAVVAVAAGGWFLKRRSEQS